jgi:hypothetical protein
MPRRTANAAAVLALGAAAGGAIAAQGGNGRLPKASETVHLNPAAFTPRSTTARSGQGSRTARRDQ